MSHYFNVPLSLAITALTPGMVDTAGTGTLIFPGGAALRRPASPLTADLAAVALPTVACRAHQHFGLAASARIGTCADQVFGIHLQIPLLSNERHASMGWMDYDRRIGGGHLMRNRRRARASAPCWWAANWSNYYGNYLPRAPTWHLLVATPTFYGALALTPIESRLRFKPSRNISCISSPIHKDMLHCGRPCATPQAA